MSGADSGQQSNLGTQLAPIMKAVLVLVSSAALGVSAKFGSQKEDQETNAGDIFRETHWKISMDEIIQKAAREFAGHLLRIRGLVGASPHPSIEYMIDTVDQLRVASLSLYQETITYSPTASQIATLFTAYRQLAQYALQFGRQKFPLELYALILTTLEPGGGVGDLLLAANRSEGDCPDNAEVADLAALLKPITKVSLCMLTRTDTMHRLLGQLGCSDLSEEPR